jgi:hypothetical protein
MLAGPVTTRAAVPFGLISLLALVLDVKAISNMPLWQQLTRLGLRCPLGRAIQRGIEVFVVPVASIELII